MLIVENFEGMNLSRREHIKYVHVENLDKELSKALLVRTLPTCTGSDIYETVLKKKSQRDTIPVQFLVLTFFLF